MKKKKDLHSSSVTTCMDKMECTKDSGAEKRDMEKEELLILTVTCMKDGGQTTNPMVKEDTSSAKVMFTQACSRMVCSTAKVLESSLMAALIQETLCNKWNTETVKSVTQMAPNTKVSLSMDKEKDKAPSPPVTESKQQVSGVVIT